MKTMIITLCISIFTILPIEIVAAEQKPFIELIAKDNHKPFKVSYEVAKLSGPLKTLIEDLTANKREIEPTPVDVDSNTLKYLVPLMQFVEPLQNEPFPTRLHKIRDYISRALANAQLPDWIKLLQAINFMHIEKLLEPFVDSMVRYMYKRFNGNINTIIGSVVNMPVETNLKSLLAKYWDLNYGETELPGIAFRLRAKGIMLGHFSLEELWAFNHLPSIDIIDKRLNLNSLHTDDLRGLETIPGIESVRELLLAHNNLETIPEGIFDKLSNLKILDLSFNHLVRLPRDIFKLKLDRLILNGNPIDPAQRKELEAAFGDKVRFVQYIFPDISEQEGQRYLQRMMQGY